MKNNDGMTAFHLACITGSTDVLKELLKSLTTSVVFKSSYVIKLFMENASTLNINLNIKNNDGMTAFHLAYLLLYMKRSA